MKPLVSVVIPVYNGSHHVVETLASVINQAEVNLEIVVSDDASIDNSVEVVERILDSATCKVKFIKQSMNLGAGLNMDAALGVTEGDWVCIFSHDDLMPKRYLSSALRAAETQSVEVITANLWPVTDSKTTWAKLAAVPDLTAYAPEELHARLWSRNFVNAPGMLLSRRAVEVLRPHPQAHTCGDWAGWLRLSRYFRFGVGPTPVGYRLLQTGISRSSPPELFIQERNGVIRLALIEADLERMSRVATPRGSALACGIGALAYGVLRDPTLAPALAVLEERLGETSLDDTSLELLTSLISLAELRERGECAALCKAQSRSLTLNRLNAAFSTIHGIPWHTRIAAASRYEAARSTIGIRVLAML